MAAQKPPASSGQNSKKNSDNQSDYELRLAKIEWRLSTLDKIEEEVEDVRNLSTKIQTLKLWAVAFIGILFATFGLSWRDVNKRINEAYQSTALRKFEEKANLHVNQIQKLQNDSERVLSKQKEDTTRLIEKIQSDSDNVLSRQREIGQSLIAQINSELEVVKKLHNDFQGSSNALLKKFESQDVLAEISKVNRRLEGLYCKTIKFDVPMKWQEGEYTIEVPLKDNIITWWWDGLHNYPYYWATGDFWGRWEEANKRFIFSWKEVKEPLHVDSDYDKKRAMEEKESNEQIKVAFRALILPDL